MVKCAHHGRRACLWCLTTTLSFPLEHALWEKLPYLSRVTALLGL